MGAFASLFLILSPDISGLADFDFGFLPENFFFTHLPSFSAPFSAIAFPALFAALVTPAFMPDFNGLRILSAMSPFPLCSQTYHPNVG